MNITLICKFAFYTYFPKGSSHLLHTLRGTGSFADDCLYAHNVARGWHTDTPEMTWDDDLASQMQNYLDSTVNTMDDVPQSCKSPHGCGYGENHFSMVGLDTTSQPLCAYAVFDWYQQSYYPTPYDYSKSFYFQGDVSYFTQVIWKESTKVGCAAAQNTDSKKWYIFCMYQSNGNIPTKFASSNNIKSTKSGYVQPTSPVDFMQNCKNMYDAECDNLAGQCGEVWEQPSYGPSYICPEVCGAC